MAMGTVIWSIAGPRLDQAELALLELPELNLRHEILLDRPLDLSPSSPSDPVLDADPLRCGSADSFMVEMIV